MAKAKISSKDFLDLLDEQNDQPVPVAGLFGRSSPSLLTQASSSEATASKQASEKSGLITDNKVATNREQTGNKVGTKPATNRQQTANELAGQNSDLAETGNKVGTKPTTLSATKWQQTENKLATNSPFSSLVGLQRGIVVFLYDECKIARGRATAALTLEHIATCLKTSAGSAKTTIQRLENKGCITRVEFKNGRGGWSKYELPEVLFREMLQLETGNKLATNREQTGNKVGTKPATEPATSLSSSSSSINSEKFKTTTTSDPELFDDGKVQLAPEWSAMDASPLSEVGFTQIHVVQLAKHGKLSAAEIQDSIHFFAFDLKRNAKGKEIKGPPLNFFMGILRKGFPYAPPENYESPEQAARRNYLDGKRRIEEKRLTEERELRDLEFSEWRRGVPVDELARLLPDWAQKPGHIQDNALRVHFDEQVYPALEAAGSGATAEEHAKIRAAIEQSLGVVRG